MSSIINLLLFLSFIAVIYYFYKFIKEYLRKGRRKPRRGRRRVSKKPYLSKRFKNKADRKYRMLLKKWKQKHKRVPNKNEKFRIVIAASHHTYPVKGRNSRRWMRGKKGHWKRQRVRKYLLEKHKIVDDFVMK